MEAVLVREFGPPEVLASATVEEPRADAGQVVIGVELASVTFVETQIRAGRPPNPAMRPALPFIPGNGVGGTVVAVGAGVDKALLGGRFISSTGGSGGYAERASVGVETLVSVPGEMSMPDAVALLADGRTAMALIDALAVSASDTVLVEAAAGGVGSLLVQLARGRGARVAAAAGGTDKLELARSLGADVLIDYTAPGWAARARREIGPVDVVFDGVGGETGEAALGLLAPGGRFCSFGLASGALTRTPATPADGRGVTIVRGTGVTRENTLHFTRAALAEAAAGRLRPVIGQTFALADAHRAHTAIEQRATVGKTLLQVG